MKGNEHFAHGTNKKTEALDIETEESTAWANVSSKASAAVSFWNGFLRLRSDDSDIDAKQVARILCIVRAVSWVESRHGTGTGSGTHPDRDPMQCGNPGDVWWQELTDCSLDQDRFVGGPSKPNHDACELPNAAASTSGFPADAAVSKLGDAKKGHNDGNFTALMSYYWGIPILIHKTNTKAGDKTYQCGDLSHDRLVAGAVAYNGGGVSDYKQRIEDALTLIGCL
jgi:hypothetical protein